MSYVVGVTWTDPRLTRIPPANAAAVETAEHYEDEKLDIGP